MSQSPAHELAERLTATERERRWTNVRPKDAATLIILDRSGAASKVLMGRRHPGHKFMPGKFVFPGGRAERADRLVEAESELHPRVEEALAARVTRPAARRGRGLALAAIRETFEETGLLLGSTREGGPSGALTPDWTPFREHGVRPDLAGLRFVARAITPPRRPRRFDTRFFAVEHSAIAARIEGITGPDAELLELAWVSLAETKELDLPAITRVILEELEHRIAAGFGHDLPVPFYYERQRKFVREVL